MRKQIATAVVAMLSASAALAGEKSDLDCGGVMGAHKTSVIKDHKEMIKKLGFYAVDGTVLQDGKSTCTSIRIECLKKEMICRTATAVTHTRYDGKPAI